MAKQILETLEKLDSKGKILKNCFTVQLISVRYDENKPLASMLGILEYFFYFFILFLIIFSYIRPICQYQLVMTCDKKFLNAFNINAFQIFYKQRCIKFFDNFK